VALKAYLQAAGRWEQLEWERVYAWIDAVVKHHKAAVAPEPERIVSETAPESVDSASAI
jgi:hypothetical protein